MHRIVCFIICCVSSLSSLVASDVLCVGNALVDTFAFVSDIEVSRILLDKGGEASVSTQFLDRQLDTLQMEPTRVTGGSAANTAKGLGRLGCSVSLLARFGTDDSGNFVRSVMKKNRVHVCCNPVDGTTSRVLCLITPEGQRSFLFCGGTSGTLSHNDLDESEFAHTKIIHHDGYNLRSKPILESSLALCHKFNIRSSMDLGAFSLVRENKTYIKEKILPHVDILFGNLDEMNALFGSDQEIHSALLVRKGLSVVLMAEKGCRIYENGTFVEIPTTPQKAFDSTGAGDLFISGFLYGLIQGWSIEKSAHLGHRLAGIVIRHLGAEIPDAYWSNIGIRL